MLEGSDVAAPAIDHTLPVKRPAHRPSRRRQILDAATVVFAQKGYVAANLEDIARAAEVAPTAIYYHFGGKEELFNQALRAAMTGFSDRILQTRSDADPGTIDALRNVLRAGWDFWYAHPHAARLVGRYSESSTAQAAKLRHEWEERHLERAYDYVPTSHSSRSTRKAREQHAAHTMAIRVMLDVILTTQAAMLDGSLGRIPSSAVVAAAEEVCVALVLGLD
jgi:AcrR family transcriptional regulator